MGFRRHTTLVCDTIKPITQKVRTDTFNTEVGFGKVVEEITADQNVTPPANEVQIANKIANGDPLKKCSTTIDDYDRVEVNE